MKLNDSSSSTIIDHRLAIHSPHHRYQITHRILISLQSKTKHAPTFLKMAIHPLPFQGFILRELFSRLRYPIPDFMICSYAADGAKMILATLALWFANIHEPSPTPRYEAVFGFEAPSVSAAAFYSVPNIAKKDACWGGDFFWSGSSARTRKEASSRCYFKYQEEFWFELLYRLLNLFHDSTFLVASASY